MRTTPEVLVIGGGVIGCAIADTLAAEGRSVLVAERGAVGGEASSAAAGVLAVASGGDDGPRLALRRASLAQAASLVARLVDETGIDVGYAASGVLELAFGEEEAAAAPALAAHRRGEGFRAELLDAGGVRAAAPLVDPAVRAGVLFPDDVQVHPGRFTAALAASARRRGAEIVTGTPVVGAERSGDRVARVRVGGEWVTPATVVLAAGAWAGGMSAVAAGLPVGPARGQMLALRPSALPSTHVLSWNDGYVVPRADGEVVVGSTVEHVGFVKAVTPAGIAAILGNATRIVPTLTDAALVRAWAGLRPFTPDGGPLLGWAPDTRNVVVACGHHRNGILLAPITAEIVAALIGGRPSPVDLAPFLPAEGSAA